MQRLKELYMQSYFAYLLNIVMYGYIPVIYNAFKKSAVMIAWKWFDKNILNSKIFLFFFDTELFSDIFYKSYFYRRVTLWIRKASFHIPKASIGFSVYYVGFFLMLVLLFPERLWSDFFWMPIFMSLCIFYISRSIRERTGTVFVLVNSILFLFLALIEIAIPHNTITPLVYLLLGIDIFFLISFSVRTLEDLRDLLKCLFISGIILCGIGFIQNTVSSVDASAVFRSGILFGEILILIFPFAFLYSMEFEDGTRRWLYIAALFIFFFNAIAATHSKAALIGFLIEVCVFILADIKFSPFLIFMLPLGLGSVIQNIKYTWHTTTAYGNPVNNIINLFRNVWKFGFGVDSSKFLDVYNSLNLQNMGDDSILNLPIKISPVYLHFILEIGAVFIFIFMFYVLRLAHSALTSIFVADKKYRRFFTAGLATLVGISVSSFFEVNLFNSRIMLIYWAMLGILRSIKIISRGVYEG